MAAAVTLRPLVMALVLLSTASCVAGETTAPPPTTTSGDRVTTTTVVSAPTTIAVADTTTTTTTALPLVTLTLDSAEHRTLGPETSVYVEAVDGSWSTSFTATSPSQDVSLANEATVVATFRHDGADTEVSWTQTVSVESPVLVQPWRTTESRCRLADTDDPVVVIWQSLGDRASYRAQLDAAPDLVNVVSPIWWFVQADGTISDRTDPGYVADVHDRGRAIWPAIAGLDADANHAAFSDPARRLALAQQLSDRANEIGADGINLDIEGYRDEDGAAFTAFVELLVPMVHEWGGIVSYDVIPRTDTWDVTPPELSFWSTAPQRRELSAAVDCMILMAYDQHNRFRPAGPVAAPAWVVENLQYLLRYADSPNVVLGVPFYGRVWDPGALDAPKAVGIGRLPVPGTVSFDSEFNLEKVVLDDGRFYWNESPGELARRLALVDEFGLAGWAAWRFGFDSPGLWEALDPAD